MKKTAIGIGIAIVVVVLIVVGVRSGSTENTADQGPIKVGIISPYTGDAASYGEVVKNGSQLAVDDINAHGGINGRQIQAIYEDSKCDGKDALSAAEKLIEVDHVDALAGAVCSSEVLGALPLTEAKPMIFLGLGSSPDITGKGKYFFRTWPSDTLSSQAMVDRLTPTYKRIAIVTEQTDYALPLQKAFIADTAAAGGNIVASETFSGDTKDFRGILSKIKLANPDVLFINAQTGQNAAAIAKQARALGITAQFAEYFFTGDEYVKSGAAVEGTIILDNPSLDSNNPKAKAYMDMYQAKYSSMAYPFIGAQMYDQLHLLSQAISKVGLDAEKLKAYFNAAKYSGVIGDYSFDQNGDVIGVGFSFKTIKDGKLVDLK